MIIFFATSITLFVELFFTDIFEEVSSKVTLIQDENLQFR